MTRVLALLLTVLTGFSGLVYEVTWEKYLATLLGSHSEATAAVLAIFLGGLSLGYSLFGRVTRSFVSSGRGDHLLLLYALVEGGIGVYALLFPRLFRGVLFASAALPEGAAGVGFAFDVGLAALLIGPPAVLMGGTIPILTQALSRTAEEATRFHALVYALNTAGAFAGALAAGFLLIPRLGLVGVVVAMGLVNLAACAVFALLGLRRPPPSPAAGSEPPPAEGLGVCAAAALLVGFAMMSLQALFIRVGALSLGASQFTFSMVVATFVSCIALGSLAVSALGRVPRAALASNQWLLVALLSLLYVAIPYAPYASHVLRTFFRDTHEAFYAYYVAVFLSILLFIGPAVALSGATLPLLFDHLRRQVGDLGAVAGRLYSWNTLGSLLGALLGGYALLFWLDLAQVYRVALAALSGAAFLIGSRLGGRVRRVSQGLLAVSLLFVLFAPAWDPRAFVHGPFRLRQPTEHSYAGAETFLEARREKSEIVFYDDDPISTVAVIEQKSGSGAIARSIVNNGKSDGHTFSDYTTMALVAILPALMAERAESAFVIGFGTGVSVGELSALSTVTRVVVSEISPAVMRAAPLFDFANLRVSESEKVEVLRTDAYRALLGSDDEYDVIVSEPSNAWVQGVEMLYSKEFLTAARDRLRPGGVYAQWHHQYETDSESLELVLRTYAAVFDRMSVWYGVGPDLIILGFREGARPLDLERLRARAEGPVFRPGLERSKIASFTELLAHELVPLGVIHEAGLTGRLHTLYEPILGFAAARAFYRGEGAPLPFTGFQKPAETGRRNSLLANHAPNTTPEELYEGLCGDRQHECVALLAHWYHRNPDAPAIRDYIRRASLQKRTYGSSPSFDLVRSVSLLYRRPGEEPPAGPVSLAEAKRASTEYARYYTHAIPFSPEALLDLWQRCAGREPEPARRCRQGLVRARQLLAHGVMTAPVD
jgi:spermidine synthase